MRKLIPTTLHTAACLVSLLQHKYVPIWTMERWNYVYTSDYIPQILSCLIKKFFVHVQKTLIKSNIRKHDYRTYIERLLQDILWLIGWYSMNDEIFSITNSNLHSNVSIQQSINCVVYLTPGSIPQYTVRSRFTKMFHYYGNKWEGNNRFWYFCYYFRHTFTELNFIFNQMIILCSCFR